MQLNSTENSGKTHPLEVKPHNFGSLVYANPTKFKTWIGHGTAHKP